MKKLKLFTMAVSAVLWLGSDAHVADKPNILMIWGDDIGQSNISAYTRGMMAIRRPN